MKFAVALLAASLSAVQSFAPHPAWLPRQHLSTVRLSAHTTSTGLQPVTVEDLVYTRDLVDDLIKETNAGPLFVRLAWHDSGPYDATITKPWPAANGAVGSIRFEPEITHGANNGLNKALDMLEPIKQSCPNVSYADILQMASARSIELAGGPSIHMIYGRVDAQDQSMCTPEGNLPDGEPGPNGTFGGRGGTSSTESTTPNGHLRKVFYRQGLNDEEIVALSGAHTFGRAYKDRSGLGAEKTKFTDGKAKVMLADGTEAKYKPGGSSWTNQWLTFDNSYYHIMPDPDADPELLKMSTDKTLFDDEDFKPFAEKFRDSQDAFFESYAKAHKKLSEQGSKFDPEGGLLLPAKK